MVSLCVPCKCAGVLSNEYFTQQSEIKGLYSKLDRAGVGMREMFKVSMRRMEGSVGLFEANGKGQFVSLPAEFTRSSLRVGVIGSFIFWKLCVSHIREIQIRLFSASF